jgi:hypothetical protein
MTPSDVAVILRHYACELLASAPSGGGRVSEASRELLARQQRRTPHPVLLRRCLARTPQANGTPRRLAWKNGSSSFGHACLSMGCRWIRAFQRRAREKCSGGRGLRCRVSIDRNLRGCRWRSACGAQRERRSCPTLAVDRHATPRTRAAAPAPRSLLRLDDVQLLSIQLFVTLPTWAFPFCNHPTSPMDLLGEPVPEILTGR